MREEQTGRCFICTIKVIYYCRRMTFLGARGCSFVVIRTSCASPLPAADRPLHRALPLWPTSNAGSSLCGQISALRREAGTVAGRAASGATAKLGEPTESGAYVAEHFGGFRPKPKAV